ncbi:hypothetical protein [Streptomyces sp. NPDC047928]|uniref:hypothetical protein n=1 Tax=unclassified Streptomyces TaxID=2593676 RepID=UPI003718B223
MAEEPRTAQERASHAAMAVVDRLLQRDFWVDRATLQDWLDDLDSHWPEGEPQRNRGLDQLHWDLGSSPWPDLREHPVFRHIAPYEDGRLPELTLRAASGGYVVIAAAIGSAALLPFLQALATRAGERAYDSARSAIRALVHRWQDREREVQELEVGDSYWIVVHEDRTGLSFHVPPNLPDAALQALIDTDLKALAAPPEGDASVVISWNEQTRTWRRSIRPRPASATDGP